MVYSVERFWPTYKSNGCGHVASRIAEINNRSKTTAVSVGPSVNQVKKPRWTLSSHGRWVLTPPEEDEHGKIQQEEIVETEPEDDDVEQRDSDPFGGYSTFDEDEVEDLFFGESDHEDGDKRRTETSQPASALTTRISSDEPHSSPVEPTVTGSAVADKLAAEEAQNEQVSTVQAEPESEPEEEPVDSDAKTEVKEDVHQQLEPADISAAVKEQLSTEVIIAETQPKLTISSRDSDAVLTEEDIDRLLLPELSGSSTSATSSFGADQSYTEVEIEYEIEIEELDQTQEPFAAACVEEKCIDGPPPSSIASQATTVTELEMDPASTEIEIEVEIEIEDLDKEKSPSSAIAGPEGSVSTSSKCTEPEMEPVPEAAVRSQQKCSNTSKPDTSVSLYSSLAPLLTQNASVKPMEFTQPLKEEASSIPASRVQYNPGDFDEYACEIYDNLRRREHLFHVKKDYFEHQPYIKPKMRAVLVDWLIEVHQRFELEQQTLYLAVNYVDRYVAMNPVQAQQFQLVGMTALLMASKFEEIYPADMGDLIYISDSTFTKADLVACEKDMLRVFKFELSVPTCLNFMGHILTAFEQDPIISHLANYFCEHSLLDFYFCAEYAPSVVASASLLLSYCYSENQKPSLVWTSRLEELSGYHMNDLLQCARDLLSSFLHSSELVAVQNKYRRRTFGRVSQLPLGDLENLIFC